MKASAANFLTIIKGPKQFVIPIYQRTYSWQIGQCRQLLKDILRISQDDSVPGHFIGSIVYFQESIHTQSDVPQLLVIDGQQRLTTISLLIAAIAEFIEANPVEIDSTPTKLRNYYLFNAEEDSELRFKLLLTRRDKLTLNNILKTLPSGENPSLRVVENFEFFKSQINIGNVIDIYNGVLRLFVVDVALEKDKDNPQLIFESLNSTGLDLSQADLIGNFILMGQHIDVQTELYEKYWFPMEQSFGNDYASRFDWFIRDYLSAKTGKIPVIGRVYEDFKTYVQAGNTIHAIAPVVADIYEYAKYYVNFALNKEPDEDLGQLFKNISRLRVDVCYPFLLPVYNDYTNKLITKDEFARILSLIENYVFQRVICGIPTNSLNKTFGNLYKFVRPDAYIESIEASFQLMDGYQRFPNDAEIESELLSKDAYNLRSRNYLLGKLENSNRKEIVSVDEYTIEHILPQNPDLSDEWKTMLGSDWKSVQKRFLHTLGNLTLTGYNSELSDRPYTAKKQMPGGFDDSPIRLNAYLRNVDQWNENEIVNRAVFLAEKAKTIWEAPHLPDEVLEKYRKVKDKAGAEYSLEIHDHLTGEMLDLFNTLRRRILNIDSSVGEEIKKLYIAYKSSTNFVDIIPQKTKLKLSLNIEFSEIVDERAWCKDVAGLGRWGNGDVEVSIDTASDLDYSMDLILQAFEAQIENP